MVNELRLNFRIEEKDEEDENECSINDESFTLKHIAILN